MAREPICMGCGKPTGPLPRLNPLRAGRACPPCADGFWERLPPLLPASPVEVDADGEEWADGGEDPGDDFLRGA